MRGAGRGRVHGGGEEVRPDLPPRLVVHLQAARHQEAAQRRRRPQMSRFIDSLLLLFMTNSFLNGAGKKQNGWKEGRINERASDFGC